MNRCTTLIFATVLSALTAGPVAAQLPADGDDALPPRSEFLAELLEALVPLAGHAYAGDWTRGVFPTMVRVAGGAVAIAHHDFCILWCSTDDGDIRWFTAGAAVYLGGTLWGVVSARRTVRDRNASLLVEPAPNRQVALGIRMRF